MMFWACVVYIFLVKVYLKYGKKKKKKLCRFKEGDDLEGRLRGFDVFVLS